MDDLPRVDADPQLQGARAHPQAHFELLERADQRQPGADRALGVVVAGAWCTEHRHGGIPNELLDHPAIALHRFASASGIRVLDGRHVLGVQLLGQWREADQVGKQDADDATLDRRSHSRASRCLGHGSNCTGVGKLGWLVPRRWAYRPLIGRMPSRWVPQQGNQPDRGCRNRPVGRSATSWPLDPGPGWPRGPHARWRSAAGQRTGSRTSSD